MDLDIRGSIKSEEDIQSFENCGQFENGKGHIIEDMLLLSEGVHLNILLLCSETAGNQNDTLFG